MGGGLVCACRKRRPESVNAGLSHTVRQAAAVRPRPGLRPGRPHLGNNLVRHSALERGFPPLGSGPGYTLDRCWGFLAGQIASPPRQCARGS